MKNHKFSLILCTLGRTDLVGDFITSLSSQTYQNLELIIVDQNEDERIHQLLKRAVEENGAGFSRSSF